MIFKFLNVGFDPGGKPTFPKSATVQNRTSRVESVKTLEKMTKWHFLSSSCSLANCYRNLHRLYGRSPYKFSPVQHGENLVHDRGWLPLVKQITEEISLAYVEKRSPTKVFGIVSKENCDEKTMSPLRLVCDAMGCYRLKIFFVPKKQGSIDSLLTSHQQRLSKFTTKSHLPGEAPVQNSWP